MNNDAAGHRKRLRTKFLKSGLAGFNDYEIIELLLTLGIPRKDCKSIAKELIRKYKSVSGVINADDSELIKIPGLGQASIIGLKLAREIGIYIGQESLASNKHGIIDVEIIGKQLIREIGSSKKEVFKIICLDTKDGVISETISIGSLNSSVVQPREVFKVAIENNSTSIIIAHNHPSGDTTPSDDDIYTTRKIVEAGKVIDIDVRDHIIVSSATYVSLNQLGYI